MQASQPSGSLTMCLRSVGSARISLIVLGGAIIAGIAEI